MEIIDTANGITAIIGLLMLYYLRKLFAGDIGDNKAFSAVAFIGLGAFLLSWRSGSFEAFLISLGMIVN